MGDPLFGQFWTVPNDPHWLSAGYDGFYTAIAAGEWFNLALRSDGTIWAWGLDQNLGTVSELQLPGNNEPGMYKAIAAGGHHGVALRADGSVFAWGGNFYGTTLACLQTGMTHPGDVPVGLQNSKFIAIGAGHTHSYGILADTDRTIVGWGCGCAFDGIPLQPGGYYILGTSGASVTGGYQHGAALTTDGALLAWGVVQTGFCNDPANFPTPYPPTVVAPPYQGRIVLLLGQNNVGRHNVFLYQPPSETP